MKIKINSTEFGSVTINNKKYQHDVIITAEGEVQSIKTEVRHLISEKEFYLLLKGNPEIILIGSGQYNALRVDEKVKDLAHKKGVKIIILKTPEAVKKFNELNKRVSAYIHVTC